jgi:hypothetical protein
MTAPLSAAYRFAPDPIWKNEKNPAKNQISSAFFSFDCLDARGQAQRSLTGRCVIPRLREKGSSKGMLKIY